MLSPPSSPSVLACTSRHNILRPRNEERDQKSLRLFLGHDSDDDNEDESDECFLTRQAASSRMNTAAHTITSRCSTSESSDEAQTPIQQSPRKLKRIRPASSPKKLASIFAVSSSKTPATGILTTPTKKQKNFLVKGNVTPSRAFSIFKAAKQRKQNPTASARHGIMTPPTSSPLEPMIFLERHVDQSSPSKRPLAAKMTHLGPLLSSPSSSRNQPHVFQTSAPSLRIASGSRLSSRPQKSAFSTESTAHSYGACSSAASAVHTLRHGRVMSSFGSSRTLSLARPNLDTRGFRETFVSPSSSRFQLPSGRTEGSFSHPISAAYSYSSRSVCPSAQWLAVGDDEGRITLVNTLPSQDPSVESFTSNPSWDATQDAAVFELTWRFDDRAILSGSSDYTIRSWDTEFQKCTGVFDGHAGSPRTIVYDPTTNGDGGCGNIFASAGRDGSIRVWDVRVSARTSTPGSESGDDAPTIGPVLSIESAHTSTQVRLKPRRGQQRHTVTCGVTALAYLPDGQGHKLLSGGSGNAVVKCWDLRHLRNQACEEVDLDDAVAKKQRRPGVQAGWETPDLSLMPAGLHRRSHGLSQILSSSTHLFASCTGGRIYSLPLGSFLDRQLMPSRISTLYDPVQCQNTLFSRMALFNDQFLAVGCNSGHVALWDVAANTSTNSQAQRRRASDADEDDSRDRDEERMSAKELDLGIAYTSDHSSAVVLSGGHVANTEVNSVAWANGPNGPTLSSVGDDTNIRTWYADRAMRQHITDLAKPL
ncbi:WD40 repeat-like protein [Testicularia cyperi]|uniref:WD40 repeat-like protein n=1 Tax=Testicularia cyperi TaxID=1882483 RepID=A0A317XL51_9BASI|nr:WD40 repeat-like protein [Testicularia cyperi]